MGSRLRSARRLPARRFHKVFERYSFCYSGSPEPELLARVGRRFQYRGWKRQEKRNIISFRCRAGSCDLQRSRG
eukprot:2032984-Pyramimonas_sp.AAC.1